MSIIGQELSVKIKSLMQKKCHDLTRIKAKGKSYIQYWPQKCNSKDWGNDKCHFEIEKIDDSVFDIAFHAENKTSFLAELSEQIEKNEKIKVFKKDEYDDQNQKRIKRVNVIFDKIKVELDDDLDKKAEEIVDKMIEFYQKYGSEILQSIELGKKNKGKINFITLLKYNHNIILHGAPGTGKTYLAKKIAKEMIFGDANKTLTLGEQEQLNERCGFVQFHQSYDYTDFVEGLRPVNQTQGKIGFELKDGVFKAFCKKSLNFVAPEPTDSVETIPPSKQKTTDSPANFNSFSEAFDIDELINQGVEKLKEELRSKPNQIMTIPGVRDKNVTIVLEGRSIKAKSSTGNLYNIGPGGISDYIKTGKFDRGHDSYEPAVGKYILNHFMPSDIRERIGTNASSASTTPILQDAFIFIIDEINRGEMSKIFGELFFSVDPGYRGEKGKIKTQYANLQDGPNEFDLALGINKNDVEKEGKKVDLNKGKYGNFFIPKNVYIIGTMNDIDRSVESMDFAMRRRFAFKEITAEQSQESMFGSVEKWKKSTGKDISSELLERLKKRMKNLNEKIVDPEYHLGQAYQIGGAFFIKFAKYYNESKKNEQEAFEKLWKNHISGVVKEYLRGIDDKDNKLFEKLKNAYYKELDSASTQLVGPEEESNAIAETGDGGEN